MNKVQSRTQDKLVKNSVGSCPDGANILMEGDRQQENLKRVIIERQAVRGANSVPTMLFSSLMPS